MSEKPIGALEPRKLKQEDRDNLDIHDAVEAGLAGGFILLSNGQAVEWVVFNPEIWVDEEEEDGK